MGFQGRLEDGPDYASDYFPCASHTITVIYHDRDIIVKLNGKTYKDYVFSDTESYVKKVMELARRYPEAEIVEVYD